MTETAQGKVNDKKTAVFHRKEYHPPQRNNGFIWNKTKKVKIIMCRLSEDRRVSSYDSSYF